MQFHIEKISECFLKAFNFYHSTIKLIMQMSFYFHKIFQPDGPNHIILTESNASLRNHIGEIKVFDLIW